MWRQMRLEHIFWIGNELLIFLKGEFLTLELNVLGKFMNLD